MSDASKTDEQVQTIRRENWRSYGDRDPGYTGPETRDDRAGRSVAEAARRRHGRLQSDRQTGDNE